MSNLHPLEYGGNGKVSVSAAVGGGTSTAMPIPLVYSTVQTQRRSSACPERSETTTICMVSASRRNSAPFQNLKKSTSHLWKKLRL